MMSVKAVLLWSVLVSFVSSYRVLVFFPYPGKSHTILGEGFVRNLVKAGHNVTYVTPIPIKNPAPNLRQIDVSSNFDNFALEKSLDLKAVLESKVDILHLPTILQALHEVTEIAIKHDKVQQLLLDTSEKFDLAIIEWLYSELYVGVPAVLNCPYIWSSSIEPHAMVLRLIDQIPNPAYYPDYISIVNPPLTFSQRVSELWKLVYLFYVTWNFSTVENKVYKEAYGPAFAKRGRQMSSFEEMKYNGSLMFGNSHVSSGSSLRLPQNYIPISGYHIKEEVSPLPENLRAIMENAPHGVIYFSLGTMMKGRTMPEDMKRGFLKVFSGLKQVVIWKLEEQLPDLPKNVHIVEWAPQPSILAHPNLVLFITHGGLLSTTETLHYGVPIIGIPLFADQFINIARAVNKGFGLHVPLGYDTPDRLRVAIEEVITNPRYRQRVKELSYIYHDRPVPPGQEIVHWVEHVIKTQGAPHLRSIALMVPWYQKFYVDLIAIVSFVIYLICKILKRIMRKKKKSSKKDN